mmetsp:Transcript_97/g.211  ORF Transcript_97/g.211 Transcript_97/m.211 type:complete len:373 (-) Transcript_97:48-1166(-)
MSTTNTNEDFYYRALSSFTRHMNLASMSYEDTEAFAKSLIENDSPKIDAAVKSYLSLVAARSAVASKTDVLGTSTVIDSSDGRILSEGLVSTMAIAEGRNNENPRVLNSSSPGFNQETSHHPVGNSNLKCTFATNLNGANSPVDANRCALICARNLLTTINSTKIPPLAGEDIKGKCDDATANQLEKEVIRILWNWSISKTSDSNLPKSIDNKKSKPSKLFGKKALVIVYPYIIERFRRGLKKDETNKSPVSFSDQSNNLLQSISDEELPPVLPPTGIDIGQWEAFYFEFGELLSNVCCVQPCVNEAKEDDSALLWSTDRGVTELQQRRERRAQRATDALAVAEAGYEVLDSKVDENLGTDGDANNAGKEKK